MRWSGDGNGVLGILENEHFCRTISTRVPNLRVRIWLRACTCVHVCAQLEQGYLVPSHRPLF